MFRILRSTTLVPQNSRDREFTLPFDSEIDLNFFQMGRKQDFKSQQPLTNLQMALQEKWLHFFSQIWIIYWDVQDSLIFFFKQFLGNFIISDLIDLINLIRRFYHFLDEVTLFSLKFELSIKICQIH